MKYKLKIMKSKPEVSEEEIRAFMNFDQLLKSHETLIINNSKAVRWKKISIVTLALIAVSTVWYLNNDSRKFSPEKSLPSVQHDTNQQQIDTTTASHDPELSITEKPSTEPFEEIPLPKKQSANPGDNDHDAPLELPANVNKSSEAESVLPPNEYTQASPVDGYPALYEYFNKALIYPEEGLQDSIQGIVTVSFIINEAGKPEKIYIENSLGEPFDRETKKVIENMPLWKPAMMNNKPVPSKLSMPMTFQIQKIRTKD